MRRGGRGGPMDGRTLLPASVAVGLLCLGAIVAAALDAAPDPEADAHPRTACRWEVAAGAAWPDGRSGAPAPAEDALPVTLLLDQCSGRTWTLAFGRGAFEWRPVRRVSLRP